MVRMNYSSNARGVIAGLDPAIHHSVNLAELDGCPDQVRA
jgi:hypothetical protein